MKSAKQCFRGLHKTTLIDFPGHIAATLFVGGCNFKCQYCYNTQLVNGETHEISWDDLYKFLERRKYVLQGLCISGGEPTMAPFLPEFLKDVRDEFGFKIKLDTNGYNPTMLLYLVSAGLVDHVTMDIKNCAKRYAETTGLDTIDLSKIKQSIHILRKLDVPHQFRTVLTEELHTLDDIQAMIHDFDLKDNHTWSIVRSSLPTLSGKIFSAPSSDVLDNIKNIVFGRPLLNN